MERSEIRVRLAADFATVAQHHVRFYGDKIVARRTMPTHGIIEWIIGISCSSTTKPKFRQP
jgi:hypothetical protein